MYIRMEVHQIWSRTAQLELLTYQCSLNFLEYSSNFKVHTITTGIGGKSLNFSKIYDFTSLFNLFERLTSLSYINLGEWVEPTVTNQLTSNGQKIVFDLPFIKEDLQ